MGMKERRVSAKKEIDGIPTEYDDFRVTLARHGGHNKAFLAHMEKLTKPQRKALELGYISNDKANKWFQEAYAATIITNWEVKRLNPNHDPSQPFDRQDDDKGSNPRKLWIVGIDNPDGNEPDTIPFSKDNVLKVISDDRYHDYFDDMVRVANEARLYREDEQVLALKNS